MVSPGKRSGQIRIAHLLPQFPYFGGRTVVGGYPSLVLNLADAQQTDGRFEATIFSRVVDATPDTTSTGVRVVRLGNAGRHAGSLLRTLLFLVRSAYVLALRRRRFDVVHVHAGYCEYATLAWLASVVTRRPTFATFYCPAADGRRRRAQRFALRLAQRRVTVTAMSANVARSLLAIGIPSRAVHTTLPIIDAPYWGDRAKAGEIDPPSGPLRVLFVGNATHTKGLDILVRAAARLAAWGVEARYTVTTELDRTSSDPDLTRLKDALRDFDLTEAFTFLRVIDDMRTLIHGHEVHVAPFRTTQGPSDLFVSTLEAMAAGVPVIATGLPGMRDVLDDGEHGFLIPVDDDEALAHALARMKDPALRALMGTKARARATELFDRGTSLDQWTRIYSDD